MGCLNEVNKVIFQMPDGPTNEGEFRFLPHSCGAWNKS